MNNTLSDNLPLLNQDAQKILGFRFMILFSINRNRYFSYLKNYIAFYNEYRAKVLEGNTNIAADRIPELIFQNYSLSIRYQVFLTLTFPVTFLLFLFHWKYIVGIKKDLAMGLEVINSVVKKTISKNSNYTAPKAKRK
jgi:hypothetical protein